jgi:hypothetical protein
MLTVFGLASLVFMMVMDALEGPRRQIHRRLRGRVRALERVWLRGGRVAVRGRRGHLVCDRHVAVHHAPEAARVS